MSEWLRLKPTPSRKQAPPAPGVLFDVVVSPYDVPEAVRGFRTAGGKFRIEFRYIDGPEPHAPEQKLDEHITCIEGKYTHRLLALEVDLRAMGAKSVGVSITTAEPNPEQLRRSLENAFERLVQQHLCQPNRQAFESTRDAVKSREDELISQLAGT